MGSGKKFYVSNRIPPLVIECFAEIMNNDIEITYFDYQEYLGSGFTDLKRNGRVKYSLNKKITIYKQMYYYYSKGVKKYKTTMVPDYIDKYCNYTKDIKNFGFIQNKIFYSSYENKAELINEKEGTKISRQTIYLHERESLKIYLPEKEAELWEEIKRLGIKASGYYHYDEEYLKISKEKYVRLTLVDAHTRVIIKDILMPKDEFSYDYVKEFMINSLKGLPLKCIITDGAPAYPAIIDELGAKHQLCKFHIMQTLMKPLNRRINQIDRIITDAEKSIETKKKKIAELEEEYPYKQGRTPKEDKAANKNVNDRKILDREKTALTDKITKYNKEKRSLKAYKERVKVILRVKTYKTGLKKLKDLLAIKDLHTIIREFLNNLIKNFERAIQFVNDDLIPKTNNLIELYYKVTFPGKIKRIYRTYEGAMNRIRLNNIRWMERNVIENFEENMQNQ